MSKKLRRLGCLVLTILMALGLFAGCTSNKGTEEQNTAAGQNTTTAQADTADKNKIDTSKKVEVTMYLAGDATADMPLVQDELSKRMEKDLNATLKIINISWSDWAQKYPLILTAGEKYDLIYSSNWAGFRDYAQKGAFLELNDLLPKYAPDIMNQVSKDGWDEASMDGKIYGIPARQTNYVSECWVIRGDLREKYGLPEVKDYDTLEAYMDAVKKNEKDIIPYNACPTDDSEYVPTTKFEFIPGTDGNIVASSYDQLTDISFLAMVPGYDDYVKRMRRWEQKGFWSKSVLTNKVLSMDAFVVGKTAVASCNSGQAKSIMERVLPSHPEWKPEFVSFRYESKSGVHPMSWMADGMAVGKNSENPDRALMVLNKIRSDRDCYDLMFYGIKNKNYVLNEKGEYSLPEGVSADKNGYPAVNQGQWGITVQEFMRRSTTEWMDYYDVVKKKYDEIATPDRLALFAFKRDSVQSEMSAISQIMTQYNKPLLFGKVDPEQGLKTLRDKLKEAGSDNVLAEVKKQLEEYCKQRGF